LRPEYEIFLKRVLQENPNEQVRGVACLSLAQFLNGRLLQLDILEAENVADRAPR